MNNTARAISFLVSFHDDSHRASLSLSHAHTPSSVSPIVHDLNPQSSNIVSSSFSLEGSEVRSRWEPNQSQHRGVKSQSRNFGRGAKKIRGEKEIGLFWMVDLIKPRLEMGSARMRP